MVGKLVFQAQPRRTLDSIQVGMKDRRIGRERLNEVEGWRSHRPLVAASSQAGADESGLSGTQGTFQRDDVSHVPLGE